MKVNLDIDFDGYDAVIMCYKVSWDDEPLEFYYTDQKAAELVAQKEFPGKTGYVTPIHVSTWTPDPVLFD